MVLLSFYGPINGDARGRFLLVSDNLHELVVATLKLRRWIVGWVVKVAVQSTFIHVKELLLIEEELINIFGMVHVVCWVTEMYTVLELLQIKVAVISDIVSLFCQFITLLETSKLFFFLKHLLNILNLLSLFVFGFEMLDELVDAHDDLVVCYEVEDNSYG
jgi:hypothetical protein